MDIEDVLDDFHGGEFDRWLNYFGDYRTFFKFLDKRGLLIDEIDPRDDQGDNWSNNLMLYLHEFHPEKYKEYLKIMLGDVDYTNSQPYIICEKGDLSALFCRNRREGLSQDSVEKILSGEGDEWFDRYWDTTQDVYRDVIEELTPENLKSLAEHIVTELQGQKIFPETEELEVIAVAQGHPGYVEVDSSNVMRILKDSETMKYLLGDQLSELRGTLSNIHSNAYNSAYESMIYNSIESELGTYFDMDNSKWSNIPHPYKKDAYIERWTAPIRAFDDTVLQYLEDNKNFGNTGTLEYHGSYLNLLKAHVDDTGECLDASVNDYPDFREVDRNINDYFKDEF